MNCDCLNWKHFYIAGKKEYLLQSEVCSVRNNLVKNKNSRLNSRRASFPRDNLKTSTSLSGDCSFCRRSTKTTSPLSPCTNFYAVEVSSTSQWKNAYDFFVMDSSHNRNNATPTRNNSSDLCLGGQEEELREVISRRCSGSWCGPNDLTSDELRHSCTSLRRTTRVLLAPIETNGQQVTSSSSSSSPLHDLMTSLAKCNKLNSSNFSKKASLVSSNHQAMMTHHVTGDVTSSLINSSTTSASNKGAITSPNGAVSNCDNKPVPITTEHIPLTIKTTTTTTSLTSSLSRSGDVIRSASLTSASESKNEKVQNARPRCASMSIVKPIVLVQTVENDENLSTTSSNIVTDSLSLKQPTATVPEECSASSLQGKSSSFPSSASVSCPAPALSSSFSQRKVQLPLAGQLTVNAKIRRASSHRLVNPSKKNKILFPSFPTSTHEKTPDSFWSKCVSWYSNW